jgi:hypothetical protein
MNNNIPFPHVLKNSIIYRKNMMKTGSPNKVNAILIVNIAGNGRTGKVYTPFPTKYKSKYVPSQEANTIVER